MYSRDFSFEKRTNNVSVIWAYCLPWRVCGLNILSEAGQALSVDLGCGFAPQIFGACSNVEGV